MQPLLRSLCCGVGEPELVPAVSGLLAGSAAVRAAALAALPAVPTLAEGLAPESGEVLAVLALARHDVNEDNAAAAEALWEQVCDKAEEGPAPAVSARGPCPSWHKSAVQGCAQGSPQHACYAAIHPVDWL